MIDRAHDLPITKQAAALTISRGSVYYLPRPVSTADLAFMRRIDELHLEFPFAGSRLLCDLLAAEGSKIGRRHVTTLMKRMGIEALYRRPRTTKPEPGHKVYPYLLRGAAITRPNQVWGDGYHLHPNGAWLRLPGRCAGLVQSAGSVVARVDHHGGSILRRDVGGGAGEARQAGDLQHRPGLAVHGRRVHRPADQERHRNRHGRQKVRGETTSSSSGCGAASNTSAYDSVSDARKSIGRYLDFYNGRRPHLEP
jgi:putative transposase